MKTEPAVIIAFAAALIQALLALATTFGLSITSEQHAAIAAVVALIAGFVTRQFVSPAVSK